MSIDWARDDSWVPRAQHGRTVRPARSWPLAMLLITMLIVELVLISGKGGDLVPPPISKGPTAMSSTTWVPPSSPNAAILAESYLVATVPAGPAPTVMVFDPARGFVYVATDVNVTVIEGISVVGAIPVRSWDLAFDSLNGFVYAPNVESNTISVINGTSVVTTIPVRGTPTNAVFDPFNGFVYVVTGVQGLVLVPDMISVINGTAVIATFSMGNIQGASVNPSNGYVYVASCPTYDCSGPGNLSVISGVSILATLTVGSGPGRIAVDPRTDDIYVPNFGSDNVTVIAGTSAVGSVPVGQGPRSAWFDASNGLVYVAIDYGSASGLALIRGTTLVASLATSGPPSGLVSDSNTGYDYLATGMNSVTILDNTSIVMTVAVGEDPYGGVFDPANGYVYISNAGSGNVSVLDGSIYYLTATTLASPNPGDAGSPIAFAEVPAGGFGSETVSWKFGDGTSASAQAISHAYDSPGTYAARVWVNDSKGTSFLGALSVVINPALQVSLSASSALPVVGRTVTLRADVTGGSDSYVYTYSGLPPGCTSIDSPTLVCQPTQVGLYHPVVTVTDSSGVSVSAGIPLHTQTLTSLLVPLLIGGVLSGVLLGVLLAYAVRRRRSRRGPVTLDDWA
jgi:DNA-binding beta-propeller fold protein YncE